MKVIDKNRRLDKKTIKAFKSFLDERYQTCQICKQYRPYEFHHAKYGAYKDDRTLIKIYCECHRKIHNGKMEIDNEILQRLDETNWESFTKEKA
ncbi:hypothetical protein [Campylobacter suis]|uniref:HNH endonuclease n=1 Tax=Campylobacter suis TaxID=2790657 RepID=A0ABM8Q5Z0_9BACT|nr:hypothetical protein [Campylobacter suis]CAD7288246.1 hypothetical protein LMG8286_01214 [Campylobacter suis]